MDEDGTISKGEETERERARFNSHIYPPTSVATNARPSVEIRARTKGVECVSARFWARREGGEAREICAA